MYTIVYSNGVRMRVVDEEMQSVIKAMHRCGIDAIRIVHGSINKKAVFITKRELIKGNEQMDEIQSERLQR